MFDNPIYKFRVLGVEGDVQSTGAIFVALVDGCAVRYKSTKQVGISCFDSVGKTGEERNGVIDLCAVADKLTTKLTVFLSSMQ